VWKDRRSGAKLKDIIESIESVEGPVAFSANDAAGGVCPRRVGVDFQGCRLVRVTSRCAGVNNQLK